MLPSNYTDWQHYADGYDQGLRSRADTGTTTSQLPTHTNDNYKDFFMGYTDGGQISDNTDGCANATNAQARCSPGHSQEYCQGYDVGFSFQSYLIHDA
jgi:hypothetical protein